MVDQVNKIIANQLFKREAVYLPKVGSLYVESRAAKLVGKRAVSPPVSFVEFSSEVKGLSLVAVITKIASIEEPAAMEIYERWLSRVKSDTGVVVENVGVLSEKSFIMDKGFDKILNPQGSAVVNRSKGGDKFIWAFAIGSILLSAYFIGQFAYDFYVNKKSAVEIASTSNHVESAASGAIGEVAETVPAETFAVEVESGSADKKGVEGVVVVKKSANVEVEKKVELISKDEKSINVTVEDGIQIVKPMTPKHYYVVAGVFSTVANAIRATKELGVENSSTIHKFGSKFMVSIYSSSDESKVRQFKSKHGSCENEYWIYRAKL